jgi:hypothetical protein
LTEENAEAEDKAEFGAGIEGKVDKGGKVRTEGEAETGRIGDTVGVKPPKINSRSEIECG